MFLGSSLTNFITLKTAVRTKSDRRYDQINKLLKSSKCTHVNTTMHHHLLQFVIWPTEMCVNINESIWDTWSVKHFSIFTAAEKHRVIWWTAPDQLLQEPHRREVFKVIALILMMTLISHFEFESRVNKQLFWSDPPVSSWRGHVSAGSDSCENNLRWRVWRSWRAARR